MPDVSVSAAFFVGVLGVLGAVIGGVGAAVKMLLPLARKAGKVFDAWEGYQDPGTGEKRPGVIERLTHMEQASTQTTRAIGQMADRLAGVEANAAAAASAVVAVGAESRERHDRLSEQVTEIDRKVDEVTARTCGTCNLFEKVTEVNRKVDEVTATTHALAAEQTQIMKAVEDLRSHQAKDGRDMPAPDVVDLRGSETQNQTTGGDDEPAG